MILTASLTLNTPQGLSERIKFLTSYGKCSKISNTFSNKMLVIRDGIHKMLVRIADREDSDQQSDLGLHCLSRPFKWQATSAGNFRTFTVLYQRSSNGI